MADRALFECELCQAKYPCCGFAKARSEPERNEDVNIVTGLTDMQPTVPVIALEATFALF